MEVRPLFPREVGPYEALAQRTGKVFYSPEWSKAFGDSLHRYGVFGERGELVSGFQVVIIRRLGVRIVRNPPFTPVIGPFTANRSEDPSLAMEERRKVLEAMAGYLAAIPRAIVSVSLDHEIGDGLPFHWKGFKTIPRYTYVINLCRSLEDIVGSFSTNRRRNISAARRDQLVVEQTADFGIVEQLVRSTFARQHARLDSHVLHSILFEYANAQNSFACVTKKGQDILACAFIVFDRTTAYYLLGGYDSENRHQGAGALALAECIRVAKERGLQTFDFEGSSIQAIERFFRGFGGQLTHYLTVNRAWLPCEILLKFVRRNTF